MGENSKVFLNFQLRHCIYGQKFLFLLDTTSNILLLTVAMDTIDRFTNFLFVWIPLQASCSSWWPWAPLMDAPISVYSGMITHLPEVTIWLYKPLLIGKGFIFGKLISYFYHLSNWNTLSWYRNVFRDNYTNYIHKWIIR